MTILVLLLTAVTPHVKVHKLPAITISATLKCETEKYSLRNPFTGRDAWYCRVK